MKKTHRKRLELELENSTMSFVRHLEKDGVTVLDAWEDAVALDYMGVAVVVEVGQEPMKTPGRQFNKLCRGLLNAIDDHRRFYYLGPNEAGDRCRKQMKAGLQPLLEPVMLKEQSPRRDILPRLETLHHLALATFMYDGILNYKIQQGNNGQAYLEKFTVQRARQPLKFVVELAEQLPQYETHTLAVDTDSISLNRIQATVVFSEQQEHTCLARYTVLALRDFSRSSLPRQEIDTASWLDSTLMAMSKANKFRATMSPELREKLRVPRLVGLVYHVWTRGSTRERPLVGGLLEHMEAATSWDYLRRRNRPPSRELQKRWAGQIRDTIRMLHDMGIVWGGATGGDTPAPLELLMASVDVDANKQPWLVRSFDSTADLYIKGKDLEAVAAMMKLVNE